MAKNLFKGVIPLGVELMIFNMCQLYERVLYILANEYLEYGYQILLNCVGFSRKCDVQG